MCSIFGFIARSNRSPRLEVIRDIVAANIGRGPHAFGFAWIDANGTLRAYKQAGRLVDQLAILGMLRGARMMIGHLRFATHGDPRENVNNHPHPVDGGWLVHNGVVSNYESLVRSERLWTNSACDSEAIGLLIENDTAETRAQRVASAVRQTTGNLAALALWTRPARFYLARRGNPLHCGQAAEGLYFGSLDGGLPDPIEVPDNRVIEFRRREGKLIRTVRPLPVQRRQPMLYDPHNYRGG